MLPARMAAIVLLALAPPAASVGRASSLSVIPISVEVVQPATVGTITLRNREPRPLNAQIRVFRWTQVGGEERLEPTEDVIPSPPIVSINAGADYIVRLQRVASGETTDEEAYRTVIDELPNPNRQRNGSIAIVLRYLVPTFFHTPDTSPPKVAWSFEQRGRATMLTATNSGGKRMQIVDLKLKTESGRTVVIGKGLAGYVLAHSSHAWIVPATVGRIGGGFVMASSDHGPVHAQLPR